MATYPVGYNPSLIPISGTSQVGDLVIGESDFEWSSQPNGVTFWMSPYDTTGYIIAHPTPVFLRMWVFGEVISKPMNPSYNYRSGFRTIMETHKLFPQVIKQKRG